ncbi:hypothetical protein [Rhizobium rhizogenes]|nr:hypothetical protein [Rhizobium rhizogenes]
MIATVLETILVAVIIIGFVGSLLCCFACRRSGQISQSEGHIE